MNARFNVGDLVWFVESGTQHRYVQCPDCLGQCALTVRLGDGSEVVIECECCREGYLGSRGSVTVWDWHCEVNSGVVQGMDIDGDKVEYKLLNRRPDAVFATKEEAENESAAVLAKHEAEEAHRFAHVKDQKGRNHSWAWSVHYHRREAKRAREQVAYHESKLAVAKAKRRSNHEQLS